MKTKVHIPTAFSPNNDGHNDEFHLSAVDGVDAIHTLVFNRWGKLIFESREMDFRWNGEVNGQPIPEGVYVCRTTIKDMEGQSYTFTNTVTVIR